MASMKNDISNSRTSTVKHREQSYKREDEINLADYLGIILKRKYFIFSCSVVPALLFGIILFISPKNCKVTYAYELRQDKRDLEIPPGNSENSNKLTAESEKDEILARDRKILLEGFFDSKNLDKLAAKLRENGFDEYARELSGEKIQTDISGTLLTMTVNGNSGEDMRKISPIVRGNFEMNLLTYVAKQELSNNISMLKTRIAEIEENKYSTELELDGQKTILTKLKNMASVDTNPIREGIVLQFDNASENRAYLPSEYQARAAQANIIYIEEAIRTNQKKNSHYKALIDLNEKLLNDIRNSTSSYDNVQEFLSFLINITGDYQNTEFNYYLNAYINTVENAISVYTPIIENPEIYPVPKDILKKSSIVFLTLLIITMFLAFLLEAVQKKRGPAS
jgi:hypothetical protein